MTLVRALACWWTVKDFNINAGGFGGAIVCGIVALAVVLNEFSVDEAGGGPIKLVVFAVIGGAIGGNWLWKRFIQSAVCPKCGALLRTENAKQCLKCGADWH